MSKATEAASRVSNETASRSGAEIFTETLPQQPVKLAVGESVRIEIGQLHLDITRQPKEWLVTYMHWRQVPGRSTLEFGEEIRQRFVLPDAVSEVSFKALLADRSLVTQPYSPINLLPGARTRIYVSSPIYFEIVIGGRKLLELPSLRLSDTWFGLRTGPGELCYSDSTRARLDVENLDQPPFKAVTPIQISNFGSKQLVLDRINVPLPLLTLYQRRSDDRYLTSSISITLQASDENTQVKLSAEEDHSNDDLVSPARRVHKKQFFSRAINLFLS